MFIASAQAFTLEKGTKLSTNTTQYNYTIESDYSSFNSINITEQQLNFSFSQETTLLTEDGTLFEACSSSCVISKPLENEPIRFIKDDAGIIELINTYADSPVYETENRTYEVDFNAHDVVKKVDVELLWGGKVVSSSTVSTDAGSSSYYGDQELSVPLVDSNNTQKNWSFNLDATYSDTDSTESNKQISSSNSSQDVFWSYWITGSTALYDRDNSTSQVKVLEGQDAGQRVNVSRETTSADLSGELNFTRTDQVLNMEKTVENSSLVQFEASELSDKVFQSSRTDYVNSSITVSFQGDQRVIEASDTVETHKIVFDQGTNGSTNALQFQVLDENDFGNTLESDVDLAVEFWADNSSQRVTRTFSSASENKTTHTYQISPSWAEIVVDSGDKLIQYQDSAGDYRLRSYFLLEETVSSDVTEIDLYALEKSRSSRIGIETVDGDGSALPQVIIRAERYFPAQDKAISVVMARTGSDGRTESFFEVNEIYYGFKFYRKDETGSYELVDEKPQQIISQDLLRFTVSDVEQIGYYDFKSGIGSSCEYNSTQVRCSYTSEEAIDVVELEVMEERPVAPESICLKKSSTASGTLICDGLNASETDFTYDLTATSGDGDQITLETGTSGSSGPDYGEAGLLISFFLFATLSLGALAGPRPVPELGVLLATVAVVVSYSAGILAITYQAAATFVILGAITIYKMRRGGGGTGL